LVPLQLRAAAAALGIVLSTSMIGALPAAAADTTGASAPAVTAPAAPADVAQASSDDSDSFADVPANHWAYQAVQELAADGYIKGYPDGTFRGNRPLTRYEIAAMTDRALSAIKAALINGDDVNKRDIDALKKLMTTYAGQLKDVQTQVAAIKAQQAALASQETTLSSTVSTLTKQEAALQAQGNATAAAVLKNRGGIQMSYKPATGLFDTEITNGPYARAAGTNLAGAVVAAPGGWYPATGANSPVFAGYGYSLNPVIPGASLGQNFVWGAGQNQNTSISGPHSQGTMVLGLKPYIKGNLDAHFSYEVRLAWTSSQDSPLGTSAATPTYCTTYSITASASCLYQDVKSNDANIPITLDRFFMQWASGGGWIVTAGKTGGAGGEGTRNFNQVIGFGKRTNGFSLEYRNLKTDWLEAAISGGNPTGLGSIAFATANNANTAAAGGVVCTSSATPGLTSVGGINPYCNQQALEISSHIQFFDKDTDTAIGMANTGLNNNPWTFWDAGAGLCATNVGNQTAGIAGSIAVNKAACAAGFPLAVTGAYITAQAAKISYDDIWFSQVLGNKALHQMAFQYDYGFRPGYDPFASYNGDCGSNKCSWTSTASQELTFVFASKGNIGWGPTAGYGTTGPGTANSNVIYASLNTTGLNGIIYPQGANGPWEGVGDNLLYGSYTDTQFEVLQYAHWFSDNFNLNVGFVHQGTLPHTTVPIGGTGCPGCYVDHTNSNTLFVDSWLAF
jgi:hypothetical protein